MGNLVGKAIRNIDVDFDTIDEGIAIDVVDEVERIIDRIDD